MQVSITRALTEIKKLDKRIANFDTMSLGGLFKVKDQEMINQAKKEFESALQSHNDMLARRASIKAAIAKANIETKIESKDNQSLYNLIVSKEQKRNERDRLKAILVRVEQLEAKKEKEDAKLDEAINQIVEKAYAGTKPSSTFVEDITKSHYGVNESIVASPMSSEDIRKRILEIDDELVELDIFLSEVNSSTMIEIPE